MSCHSFKSGDGKVIGTLCLANIFEYKGFVFEFHNYLGPILLRKDYEPARKIKKGFWDAVTEFSNLSADGKEQFRVYG